MLVVSALFVLLALGLLVAGLASTVSLIYLSICSSLVAAALLAVGVRQRRPRAGNAPLPAPGQPPT